MKAMRGTFPRSRRPGALIVALTLVTQLLVLSGAEAQVCTMQPELKDVLVTQGTGSSPLVWGKDTLVRAFLTAPSCAGAGALKFSNATLKVKVPSLPDVVVPPVSVPALGSEPTITDCCVPAINNPADPIFLIEGTDLSPPALVGGFPAALELTVNYKVGSTTSSISFLTIGNPAKTIGATFGKKPNPLRILVVPMGDKSKSATHYTSTTQANVQTSIEAVSRIFPVADVVSKTTGGTGGLRWQQATGMLDLGAGTTGNPGLKLLNGQGKFCGDSANFPAVKTALANFLQAFNSANAANPADMVVGAIDGAVGIGSATNGSCYDGIAAFNSKESWFRVVSDGSADNPSISGAVLSMELGHNFGMVNDSRADTERHSVNIAAETENKAYNLTERGYLSNDKTVMHLFGTWHRKNTLFEREDWIFGRCKLGGTATGDPAGCSGAGAVGSSAASAQRILRISGSTDGTKGGTSLLSNFTQGGAPTESDPASEYRLIFRNATTALQTFRLPVSNEFSHGHEDGSGAPAGGHDDRGVVDAGVLQDAAASSATHVQVWKGEPSTIACGAEPNCLYEAELTVAPELTEVQVNPTEWIFEEPNNFTNTSDANEIQPGLSFDGQFLTFVQERDAGDNCGALVVERVDRTARATLGQPNDCRSEPTLAPDNETLVFVRDGDLWRIKFDPLTLEFDEASERKIYACVREAGTCFTGSANENPLTGPASAPAYAPAPVTPKEDQWVVFAVDGDIFRLFPYREEPIVVPDPFNPDEPLLGITQTERITGTPETDSEPSVSPDGQEIVFTRRSEGNTPTLFVSTLPDGPLTPGTARLLASNARHPSWGGNLIAFESTSPVGNIGIINPNDSSPEAVTTTGTDTWPAVVAKFGKTMAIQRTESGQDDIYLGTTGKKVDILLRGFDVDNASETAGYIYVHCGDTDVPIAVDSTPHHPDPSNQQIVTFSADNHDPSLDCGPGPGTQGKAGGLLTDDWSLSNKAYSTGTIRTDTGKPIAAIHSPSAGSTLWQDASIPLDGSGWDAEGMVLPGTALTWELQLPGRSTWINLGTGTHVDATPQKAGLGQTPWPFGAYKARLTANDGTSSTTALVEFNITISRGRVDFDPNTLYVPSSGSDVVAYVPLQPQNLSQVSVGGVKIVELGGQKLGEAGNPAAISASKWSVSGSTGSAKFNRQTLSNALGALGLVGKDVEFVVRIQTSTFTFHGTDIVRVSPSS